MFVIFPNIHGATEMITTEQQHISIFCVLEALPFFLEEKKN